MNELIEIIQKHKLGGFLAMLMFAMRYRYTKHRSFKSFVFGLVISMTSSLFIGLLIYDYIESIYLKNAIIGASAFFADDLFFALNQLGHEYRNNPKDLLKIIKRK